MRCGARQEIEVGDRDGACAARALHLDGGFEGGESDVHVGWVGGNTGVAGAEDGGLSSALVELVLQFEFFAGIDDLAGAEDLLRPGIASPKQRLLSKQFSGSRVDDGLEHAKEPSVAQCLANPLMFKMMQQLGQRPGNQ